MRLRILFVASLSILTACDRGNAGQARAVITADPAAIAFGQQTSGTQTQRVLTLGNDGNATLHISAVRLFQDTRGTFSVGTTPEVLQPSQRVEVTVTYSAPAAEGADGASLIIESDAQNTAELTISLAARSTLSCVPRTCSGVGASCGDLNDGCGGTINCGNCVAPQSCGGGGTANSCGCTGETNAAFCARAGATCGSLTAADNCGVSRTADCGSCTAPESCGGAGTPNVCGCGPETNTAFCARLGRNCDSVTAADNCGTSRTADCGTCGGNQSCGGSGVPNVCGCSAETNVAFCARLGKNCGSVSANDNCGVARTATCGTCSGSDTCTANVCTCAPEPDTTFCSRLGKNCGSVSGTDNCGATRTAVSCGACTGTDTCSGANVCMCTPETNLSFCSRLGKNCGSVTAADNCGTTRNGVPCGSCTGTDTCSGTNVCVCSPESDTTFCSRLGKDCGSVSGTDNCGASRTSVSCGTCSGTDNCNASNVCVCTPETDTTFCTRLGKNCGSVTAADNCGTTRSSIACGTCTSPATCGGSGSLNVCGVASHLITVLANGGGTVNSSPAGITNCTASSGTCSASFADGVSVTLTVTRNAGFVFSGWSGACSGVTCSITLSGANATATATFVSSPSPTWTQRFPTGTAPSARYAHRSAMDVLNNRMIMFSGADGNISSVPTLHNDTWVLTNADGSSTPAWIQLTPSAPLPQVRGYPVIGYDPAQNALVMFGGNHNIGNCFNTNNDTWVLSNANGLGGTPAWTQRFPASPPSIRNLHTGVYDTVNQRLIVYGGQDACGPLLDEVWVLSNIFSGTITWTQLTIPGTHPAPRATHVAAYDQANNRMIIQGSYVDTQTWVLTNANGLGGTPAWIQLNPTGTPPNSNFGNQAVYDPTENELIVFAGNATNAPTPALSVFSLSNANGLGGTPVWTQIATPGGPPNHTLDFSVWYQPATDRATAWGGQSCANGSCVLTGQMWTVVSP